MTREESPENPSDQVTHVPPAESLQTDNPSTIELAEIGSGLSQEFPSHVEEHRPMLHHTDLTLPCRGAVMTEVYGINNQ